MDKVKTAVRGVYLPGLVIFLLLIFISGMAFSGEEKETLTGQLVLIGNEPFTRLICRLDEGNLKAEAGGCAVRGRVDGGVVVESAGAKVLLEGHQTGKLSEYRLPSLLLPLINCLRSTAPNLVGVVHKTKDRLVLTSGRGDAIFSRTVFGGSRST